MIQLAFKLQQMVHGTWITGYVMQIWKNKIVIQWYVVSPLLSTFRRVLVVPEVSIQIKWNTNKWTHHVACPIRSKACPNGWTNYYYYYFPSKSFNNVGQSFESSFIYLGNAHLPHFRVFHFDNVNLQSIELICLVLISYHFAGDVDRSHDSWLDMRGLFKFEW